MMQVLAPVPPHRQKTPCPHCGKPYRTLLKRAYGLHVDSTIKQSIPIEACWRCLSCGKSYTTQGE